MKNSKRKIIPNLINQDNEFIKETLREWTEDSIQKYIEGQKKHGGHITDRCLKAEIRSEVIDQMFYIAALGKKIFLIQCEIDKLRKMYAKNNPKLNQKLIDISYKIQAL